MACANTVVATSCCICLLVRFTVSIEKFKSLTEDVDFVDEESFKEKLSTLKESYFPKVSTATDSTGTSFDDEDGGTAQDVDTSDSMAAYMAAIGRNATSAK